MMPPNGHRDKAKYPVILKMQLMAVFDYFRAIKIATNDQ